MKHPMLWVAALYVTGLVMADMIPLPCSVLFAVSFSVLLLPVLLRRLCPPRRILPAALILVGWTNASWQSAPLHPYDLRRCATNTPSLVTLRGRLLDLPQTRTTSRANSAKSKAVDTTTSATLLVSHIRCDQADSGSEVSAGSWLPAYGRLLITATGVQPPSAFPGQPLEITGLLARPPEAALPGLFDYRQHLSRRGIHFQLKTQSPSDWRLLAPIQPAPFSFRFIQWAQKTLALGLPAHDDALLLLWSMTLGIGDSLAPEVLQDFSIAGTRHIFAISGLHIALIAGILVSLARLFLSRPLSGMIVIPGIWFYTAATGWQTSAARASLMATLLIGGWMIRRPTNLLNSLGSAAFIILMCDPLQMFGTSFQLSFFVVLAIALVVPPIHRLRDHWLQPDPWRPANLIPVHVRATLSATRALVTFSATSFAAFLGTLPLTARYFFLFNPISLLANLFVVPLSSAALACNLASLLCNQWLPAATTLFNHAAWFWMFASMVVSRVSAEIPLGHWFVSPPSLVGVVAYYALLIAIATGWLARNHRSRLLRFALAVLLLLGCWSYLSQRHRIDLLLFPTAGGFAAFLDAPVSDRQVLFDTGPAESVKWLTLPLLRSRGINRLSWLVLTHGDVRHVGGTGELIESIPIRNAVISPKSFRSRPYREALQRLTNSPVLVPSSRGFIEQEGSPAALYILSRGDCFADWQLLHPDRQDRFPNADDNAVVVKAELEGSSVLLLSDLGSSGQRRLLERYPQLRAKIVVSGLPFRGEPVIQEFLEQIRPELIVICDSEWPANEHAGPELHQRLESLHIPVVFTSRSGALRLRFSCGHWNLLDVRPGTPQIRLPRAREIEGEKH